jgi:DNA-binding HxlR family transcriptional regulator/putative sterol carrier protein
VRRPRAARPGRAGTKRSYGQYCGVARGLDLIGDRWTLLLVRDLLLGPKRYTDLLDGLPGIGTNLLAARLRDLEAAGLVERRVLPPPAGSTVYQLTEAGEALQPVLIAIGRWGARFLGAPGPDEAMLPSAYFVAMRASFTPELAGGVRETYEFRVGGRVYQVRVDDGSCVTSEGRGGEADVVLTMEVDTLNGLLLEGLSPSDAIAAGRVTVSGDPDALTRFVSMFAIRQPDDAAIRAASPARSR